MRISVVIPTLNEAEWIVGALRSVHAQAGPKEVIVVDGGSRDTTVELARGAARVIPSPARGRAPQMNRGANAATGDVLLFLHADTRLPDDGFDRVRAALTDPEVESGAFRLQFDRDHPILSLYSLTTRLPIPQICFGDRALFVRRTVFDAIGGFAEMPVFEDLNLVLRLHDRGGFTFLDAAVTTSARRFDRNGLLRQQARNAYLWLRYLTGTDPAELAERYPYDPGDR